MNALTYRDAGVDIDRGDELVRRIRPLAARTTRPGVRSGLGGFGGLFELPLERYNKPVLVTGTDGVGTKIRLALDHDRLENIGIDLVAMCVNDVLTSGAEPLLFLDYYATAKLDLEQAVRVISGITRGCELAGTALVGGETAEMPGMYAPGDFDLAGFTVGLVDADAVIDGTEVAVGDALVGLASSGPHSNGYSLIRKVLDTTGEHIGKLVFDGVPALDALMAPTRIYVRAVHSVLPHFTVKAMAHITGGGLLDNIPRVLPQTLMARLDPNSWKRPAVFDWLARLGGIREDEFVRTFNCGIGYVMVVPTVQAEGLCTALGDAGEAAAIIGHIGERPPGAAGVVFG